MAKSPRNDKNAGNEPQSYGSSAEWLTGRTGQTVEGTPQRATRHDEAFYEDRHQPARTDQADAGGKVSEVQLAESDSVPLPARSATATGSATRHADAGAEQRKSYWRDRDYK